MSTAFHRSPSAVPPVAVGRGIEVTGSERKRNIDASGAAMVSRLCHSDRRIIEAMVEQAGLLAFAETSFSTSEPAEAPAALLRSDARVLLVPPQIAAAAHIDVIVDRPGRAVQTAVHA